MSRLQVGGLALNLNSGSVVELISFVGNKEYRGVIYLDVWRVRSEGFHVLHDNSIKQEFGVPAKELIPLDDKQTQEQLAKELENDTTVSNTL